MATALQVSPLSAAAIEGCPACQGSKAFVFAQTPEDREYFFRRAVACEILRCADCEALYQSPFPTPDETNTFYAPDYQNYAGSRVPFLSALLDRQNRAAARGFRDRFGQDAAVLDFGCGSGAFLKSLSAEGLPNLYGYDVALRVDSDFSEKMTVFNTLDALKKSSVAFDVIRMNHVIEHLAELDDIMRLLTGLLRKEGRIIGQTPNAAHYTSRLFGADWGPLHYPYHTVLFSRQSLAGAAPRWGLRLAGVSPCPMPTGWAMSFENLFKKMTRSTKRGRSMFYTLFMAGSAPMVLFDLLRKDTGIFDFELAHGAPPA